MPLFVDRPDGCFSIDGGPEDKGFTFLRDSRQELGEKRLHKTTEAAVANVLGDLKKGISRTVDLIGHGNVGLIHTGCGGPETVCISSNRIDGEFEQEWKSAVSRLANKVDIIRLWGCCVGANAPGRQLLRRIHDVTGATVIAPTKLIFWRNGRLATHPDGGPVVWYKVSTDDPNPAIVELEPGADREPVKTLYLPHHYLEISSITAVTIESLLVAPKQSVRFDGEGAQRLVASLGISKFGESPGTPASIVTHRLLIETEGRPVVLGVYSGRWIFPDESPTYFEVVSRQFLALSSL